MPTYDYICKKCSHRFEAFQSMSDEPLSVCPECGEPALKRLIGAGAGLLFKGSGFYITDYKKSSSSPSRSTSSSTTASSSTTKKESATPAPAAKDAKK